MKKIVVGIIILVIMSIMLFFSFFKIREEKIEKEKRENPTIEMTLVEDMTLEFLDDKKVSDYIVSLNGNIVDDYQIDSTILGVQKVDFEFINNDEISVKASFNVEVIDTVAPYAVVKNTYYIKKGGSKNFYKKIFCGDNYDPMPNCYIEGEYDVNKVGTYPVTFKAVDNSGNTYSKDIDIVVYTPKSSGSSSSSSSTTKSKTKFEDVIKKYKTENSKIGLDVSKWQGTIDFDKLKEAGVEFIFIRVGWGYQGKYKLDEQFERNISEANRVGIPVGIYFYSYASTPEESINDALWVIEQLAEYKVELPIAFDWEEWSDFNDYNVSFYGLTHTAETFLDIVGIAGYDGLLYSSKYYLENIWMDINYETWLAHYTKQTNYKGDYRFWQLCSNGRVDGIKGDVDINVWYLDEDS